MEHIISIPITPPDQDALVPQVGFALEQLRELDSRRKHPKLWALSDKLCPPRYSPYTTIQKRRRHNRILGLLNWALGAFGTLIVLMPSEMPFSVTVATSICLGGWGRVSVAVLADCAGSAQPAPGVLSLLSQSGQPRGAAGPDALRAFLRRPGDRRTGHPQARRPLSL